METGQIVEFIESRKIFCAVVLEAKNLRLRLLTENNREVKLATSRLTHRSNLRLDPTASRDKLVSGLKEISARRRDLSREVDIRTLWEVLHTEQEWIDLPTMTAFCFPDQTNGDHESAVMRAFFNDRLYFKFTAEKFFPHSPEKVELVLTQRDQEDRTERIIDQGGTWLAKVLKGQSVSAPSEKNEIVRILESYYLFEKESPERDLARAMLKKAGAGAPSAIFSFLVKIGEWQAHENLDLYRSGISIQMPDAAQSRAQALCLNPPPVEPGRRDLRDLPLMTIDGPSTLDFDDALSLVQVEDHLVLGVHIADVAHIIAKGDPIDQEALARASSVYMPDQKISMLPDMLSLDICSLKAGEDRPAISFLITLSPQGKVLDYEIVPSLIRVRDQLTYQDVDAMTTSDETIKTLCGMARDYRNQRLDKGALLIELPEINIWLSPSGEPSISRVDRESPSRMLVAELMIMANDLAARFLSAAGLPAIFRSQAEPRERLFDRNNGSLFQNWMQRKHISRFLLSNAPEPHAGLGLPAYLTCTSPIRKFSDLVNQRQLRAALGLQAPYSAAEIDYMIASLAEPMMAVGRLQYRRNRYWLLKYLEGRIGKKEEAIVLNKRRDVYNILLTAYMIECQLSGAERVTLKPEDYLQVTLQHVNARNDVITVYLG